MGCVFLALLDAGAELPGEVAIVDPVSGEKRYVESHLDEDLRQSQLPAVTAAVVDERAILEGLFEEVPASSRVISFDPPSFTTGKGRYFPYLESQRMQIHMGDPGTVVQDTSNGSSYPNNGTLYASSSSFYGDWELKHREGLSFDLLSIDLAERSTSTPAPVTVTFTGHKTGGGTVVQSFTTDGVIDGTGPLADFETFVFSTDFQGLDRVVCTAETFMLDNLVVEVQGQETPDPPPPADPNVIYEINWNLAPHEVDQVTAVSGPYAPTSVNFGIPYVRQAIGVLDDRPLEFLSVDGDSYEQIRIDLEKGAGAYRLEFDLMIDALGLNAAGATMTIFMDTPHVRSLQFHGNGSIQANPGGNLGTWTPGALNRIVIDVNVDGENWIIKNNGVQLHSGPLTFTSGDVTDIRFSWIDPSLGDAIAAIDNVTLWAFGDPSELNPDGPNLSLTPSSLGFGNVPIGEVAERTLRFRNDGDETLNVTGLTLGDSRFRTGDATPFAILPGGYRDVIVGFEPTGPGELISNLTVSSNDVADPTQVLPLSGTGVVHAGIGLSHSSYEVTMSPDSNATRVLTITNDGNSTLNWTIGAEGGGGASAGPTIASTPVLPNDSFFNQLYGLQDPADFGAGIDAVHAWSLTRGSRNVLVGVIDTGVEYDHPDLIDNSWTNAGETPGNGVDDDGNGFIDDVYGWDFHYDDNDPMDVHGHGTHVAGTIAATGNNAQGVVGVAWEATVLPIKFLSDSGSGYTSDAIDSVDYATVMGARITNNSWGGGSFNTLLRNAIDRARQADSLFVAAAGNDSLNNDVYPHYPSSYNIDNVLSVASTDEEDELSWFSNYGATDVDLAAPGSDILSCYTRDRYAWSSGTSMATPHVAGAAVLLLTQNSGMTYAQVKARLRDTVDPLPDLAGKVSTGGRLNVNEALAAAAAESWLTFDKSSGSLESGASEEVEFRLDSADLEEGAYTELAVVRSNDAIRPEAEIPVRMELPLSQLPGAPYIITNPAASTVEDGDTVTLTVQAGGEGPFTYEWFLGPTGDTSVPIGTDSDTFESAALFGATSYWVRVTNVHGTVDSAAAPITVLAAALSHVQEPVDWMIGDMVAHPTANVVYVINMTDHKVYAINTATGVVDLTGLMPDSTLGGRLETSVDGNTLFVSTPATGRLHRLATADLSHLGQVQLAVPLASFAAGSDGQIYGTGAGSLLKIDPSTGATTEGPANGDLDLSSLVRRSVDGTRLFVLRTGSSGSSPAVNEFLVQAGGSPLFVTTHFTSRSNDADLSVDVGRDQLFRSSGGINGVSVWDLAGGSQENWLFDGATSGVAVGQHPDVDEVFAGSSTGIIRLFRKSSGEYRRDYDYSSPAALSTGDLLEGRLEVTANGHALYGMGNGDGTGSLGLIGSGTLTLPSAETPPAGLTHLEEEVDWRIGDMRAQLGANRVFIVNETGQRVLALNTATGEVDHEAFLGTSLAGAQLGFSIDGNTLYVAIPGSSELRAFATSDLTPGVTIAMPFPVTRFVIGSDGFLYTCYVGELTKISLATGAAVDTGPTFLGSPLMRRNADGTRFFVMVRGYTGGSPAVSEFAIVPSAMATLQATHYENLVNDRDLSFDDGDGRLYRAGGALYGVGVWDTGTDLALYWPFDSPYGAAVSVVPGGTSVVGASASDRIRVFDKATAKALADYFVSGAESSFPDGSVMNGSLEATANGHFVYAKRDYVGTSSIQGEPGADAPLAADDDLAIQAVGDGYRYYLGVVGPASMTVPFAPGLLLPETVTNVQASDGLYQGHVRVTWNAATDASSYRLYRNSSPDFGGATLVADGIATTSYDDNGPEFDAIHHYWVVSVNAMGDGPTSGSDDGFRTFRGAPAAPANVTASDGTSPAHVAVSWNSVLFAEFYRVYRDGGQIGQTSATSFLDTGAFPGTVYSYTVRAVNDLPSGPDQVSSSSSSDNGHRQLLPPPVTGGVSATDGSLVDKVRVTWSSAFTAASYRVYRATTDDMSAASEVAEVSTLFWEDTAAVPDLIYYYWVIGVNAAGAGSSSASDSGYAVPDGPDRAGTPGSAAGHPVELSQNWTDAVAATYEGLICDEDDEEVFLGIVEKFKISAARPPKNGAPETGGGYSGTVVFGESYKLKGVFDTTGRTVITLVDKKTGRTQLSGALRLKRRLPSGGDYVITGTLTNAKGQTGKVRLVTVGYDKKTRPYNGPGVYTMLLPGERLWGDSEPGGAGYGMLTVKTDGKVSCKGVLADGSKFSEAAILSRNQEFYLFTNKLYGSPSGWIGAELTMRNQSGISDFDGPVYWNKPRQTRPKSNELYPSGFELKLWAIGSVYNAPAKGRRALTQLSGGENNCEIWLVDGDLNPAPGELVATWDDKNKIALPGGDKSLKGSVSSKTGEVKGALKDKDKGWNVKFGGVVFQKQGLVGGCFTGHGESGYVGITSPN